MTTADPIQRSEERIRSTGEIFTPLELVDEILDKLPQELFTDPKKTFLDPSCGDGQFLVEVLQRKIDNGSTPTEALKTTYGVDIMDDNVRHCKQRLIDIAGDAPEHWEIVNHNIVCADSLKEWDFENWCRKGSHIDDILGW